MQKQRDEQDERPRKRRKKKSRFGYYLYAVIMLVLTLANITVATFLLTYVQDIEVTGTKYSEKQNIIDWIEEDPLTANSVYAVLKYKFGSYTIPIYLEDVSVSLKAPWKLRVKVQEKEIMGCILVDNDYVYFSEDGTVLLKGTEILDGLPVVEGLKVGNVKLYQELKIGNEKVFSYIIDISHEITERELSPDRLVWEDDSMNLYFGEICVQLGKMNFDEKLTQLPPILEKLEGKKGTLHLEHYSEMSNSISFEEVVE